MISPASGQWQDEIGYIDLQNRLGAGVPDGSTIDATQVEALDSSSNYLPDTSNSEFSGKTINSMSGSSSVSSHATIVGEYYYGLQTSIAPSIDPIDVYEVGDWANNVMQFNSSSEPDVEGRRLQNHSWIGSFGTDDYDIDLLRRMDLLVQRDGVVVAAGVNNGAATSIPHLMGSAYNVLAVGLTNGQSSYGPTLIEEPGRVKPDIVAPSTKTSWASPIVASAGGLLLETMDANYASLSASQKSLLAKCLLMGGATKAEFGDWRKGFATSTTDGSVPLDYRYGAGELNINNSHQILEAGEQDFSPSSDVLTTGWDLGGAVSTGPRSYYFEVPVYQVAREVSIMTTWYRDIEASQKRPIDPFTLTPSLANIDLQLFEASGFTPGSEIDLSISTVDNVEHIYIPDLLPGRYVFEVSTDTDWSYAVTWYMSISATVQADFDGDGDVDQDDLSYFQSCSSAPAIAVAQGCLNADFDSDTDVDQADFARFQQCFSGAGDIPDPACETPS
jgi:hypothetical protein